MVARGKPRKTRAPKRDHVDDAFGPGPEDRQAPAPGEPPARSAGPIPGIACGGEGCVLKPVADLVARFVARLARGGLSPSLARAAFSGLEMMKALRDFIDEEIALAERAAGGGRRSSYTKISID